MTKDNIKKEIHKIKLDIAKEIVNIYDNNKKQIYLNLRKIATKLEKLQREI